MVTGQSLSATCSVYFQNPKGSAYATGNQIVNPSHMKVTVPVIASGVGTIAVMARNSGAVTAMIPEGHVLPFEVKPTVPVLQSISPAQALPGQLVQVVGSKYTQGEPYMAYFVNSAGKKANAQINWLNATTFRVAVPDMERDASINEGAQYANTFYITRGSAVSNRLPLTVLPAPKCVLKSVSPTVQWAKSYVDLTGNYLTRDCDISFYSSTGQAFPAMNKATKGYGVNVQVPDMPSGKGFISTKPAGASQAGAMIPIEVKTVPSLLAKRVDVQGIQGFGQKILSVPSKRYNAGESSKIQGQVFECSAECDVYQNAGVYTYVYTFDMVESVVLNRYLNYMSLKWPDLNDGSLKYGFDLQHMGIGNEASLLKGDTKDEFSMDFWTRGKRHCSYIQSKRAPVKGPVTMADGPGFWIRVYDFYVPAP